MRWRKRGLVFDARDKVPFARDSVLTPTPVLLGDTIRVFAGFRDTKGTSRIGFVDLRADDPGRVVNWSEQPALDIGRPGTFDDNGVILGDVVACDAGWRMYYVGFQQVARAKFLAFTGLAVAGPDCRIFTRVSEAPVLDRADEGLYIRAVHTVRREGGVWRAWYAAGDGWEQINGTPYPRYHVRHVTSTDGVVFPPAGDACLHPTGTEYRIGRPRVFRDGDRYRMLCTKGTIEGDYLPAYAESRDGVHWQREDELAGLVPSPSGWDSRQLCYPAVLDVGMRRYVFYNGRDMGREGFGFAELIED